MNERAQFIWASGAIVLWLITFLFITGYATNASYLQFPFLYREPPDTAGIDAWNAAVKATPPLPALATLLPLAHCVSNTTSPPGPLAWAPLCDCLSTAYAQVAANPTCAAAPAQVSACYIASRRVQRIHIQPGPGLRPYPLLLMVNTWAAFAAAVLLVRGKLVDKGSYAIQLLLQLLLLALTLGAMWLALSASPAEWITMLVVSLLMSALGWLGDDDPDAWYSYQFQLVLGTVLPGLTVLYNAYTRRLDAIYFAATVALALALALASGVRIAFERLNPADPIVNFWGPTNWTRLVIVVLGTGLLALTYDEGDRGPVAKSSSYAWLVLTVYASLTLQAADSMGYSYFTELVARAILTVAMIDELFV